MTDPEQPPKPTSYDELYPSRFIKSKDFLGKNPTFTIADYNLEHLDGPEKKPKPIISLAGQKQQWVLCTTNGQCLKAMFGEILANWVGKRVTLCTEKDRGPQGPCDAIRVYGSPDIATDMSVTINLGPKRQPKQRTLKRMEKKQ